MIYILQSDRFQKILSKIKDKNYKTTIEALIEQLEIYGKELKEPKCKHLQDGIWELKCYNKNQESRILFFYAYNDYAIIVDIIKKQKNKYLKEIEYVKNYMKDFYIKYDSKEKLIDL